MHNKIIMIKTYLLELAHSIAGRHTSDNFVHKRDHNCLELSEVVSFLNEALIKLTRIAIAMKLI